MRVDIYGALEMCETSRWKSTPTEREYSILYNAKVYHHMKNINKEFGEHTEEAEIELGLWGCEQSIDTLVQYYNMKCDWVFIEIFE